MMPIEDLRNILEQAFPGEPVFLENPQGDNNHFQCVVVSRQFDGKTMVERHQMVYKAMGNAMDSAVHAFALKTYTPEQWAEQSGRS